MRVRSIEQSAEHDTAEALRQIAELDAEFARAGVDPGERIETRIHWRRLDIPGHEFCTLESTARGWKLAGTAFLTYEGRHCTLRYSIECDGHWQTCSASIRGDIGGQAVSLDLTRNEASEWHANGIAIPVVDGCIDVDLGFSPSTNLLPIRRLSLEIGSRATVRAAWVRFPELSVEVLEQAYTRLAKNRYLYESNDGAFRKELLVSKEGFVLEYADYWHAEAVDHGHES
jgi:hypothetical protein